MKTMNVPEKARAIANRVSGNADAAEMVRNYLEARRMMYDPKPESRPDVDVPERYRPLPDNGDYEYPESGGMLTGYPIGRYYRAPEGAGIFVSGADGHPDYFSPEMMERRAVKQRWAESGFRDNARSKVGARGAWQIMPITYKDYLGRGKGEAGNLNDPAYNRKVRDWVMGIIPRDLGEFYSESDAPLTRLAKIYGAYNWGAGNMRSYLRRQRDAGVDISNGVDWVEGLNPETRRYIKYLAFDEDIPDSTMYTNSAFEEAARSRGYLRSGGPIRIKPENRGKFTALKKRTGHSASWFKAHGTPAQKKMAVFALNSKHWSHKHADGGAMNTFGDGGDEKPGFLQRFMQIRTTQPAMPGVATSAMVANRDIPRVDSTVGDDLSYAGALLTAPQMMAAIPERGAYGLMSSAFEQKNLDPTLVTKSLEQMTKQLRRANEIEKLKRFLPTGMAAIHGAGRAGIELGADIVWELEKRKKGWGQDGQINQYDGESEPTQQMLRSPVGLMYPGQTGMSSGLVTPYTGQNYVTLSGPDVQLDDDAIYLGDIEPSIVTAERKYPEPRERSVLPEMREIVPQVDTYSSGTLLVDPGKLVVQDRDTSDRSILVRSAITGKPVDAVSREVLDSLDAERRSQVQNELASQGWYDVSAESLLSGLKNRSEETIALQTKLRDLGYDLGKYGPNRDGVDGMIGRMTRQAISKYVKDYPGDALRTAASYGVLNDDATVQALSKRVQYMKDHNSPSETRGPKVQDSMLGEENIGTHYDPGFDHYVVGGLDASNIYNVPVVAYDKEESPLSFKSFPKTADTKECASSVTNFFLKNFGGNFIDKYNLRGDAWTMGRNIEKAGGKRIFNLFDEPGAPRENDRNVTIEYVRGKAKDPEYKSFLKENIGAGDIVELLYPASPNFKKAYEESHGHNQNTHIGMVVEHDGAFYVLDNSGGTYHHTRLDDVINGKDGRGVLITGAVSVNDGDYRFNMKGGDKLLAADMSALGVTPNKEYDREIRAESGKGIKYYNYNNESAYREMASLKRNSGQLMSTYGLSPEEFNDLAALTHAASMMETRNGSIAPGRKFRAESGNVSADEGVGAILQEFGRHTLPNVSESISSGIRGREQQRRERQGKEDSTESVIEKIPGIRKALKPVSRGLTNVKVDYHFTRKEQENLPVEGNAAEQPESSALLGFSVLARNYNHIKERLVGTELGRNHELLLNLAALAHNQGLGNIDVNISRYLESGDEEELLQYLHREKEYREALKDNDEERARYYNGPQYSRLMMDFRKYNNYNLVI